MHNSFDSFLSDGRCTELAHPDKFNFGLSLFILVGILVSYLPQHLRIIFRRSSEGLSPLFVLLGTVSGTCAIFNIVSLPTSQADVACCKEISGLACTASILGIAQVGVQWFCFFIIMLLFIIFIPRPIPSRANPRASWENTPSPTWREAVTVVAICMATFVAVFIITGVFFLRYPQNLQVWANLLGASAGVMACIQYLPQIWTTWRLQHVMSLSVPMMCIQTPGSFVFAASLGLRLGWDGWSAWGVYIVTGILQGFLLVMGIIFLIRDRKADKKVAQPLGNGLGSHLRMPEESDDEGGLTGTNDSSPSETSPLLDRTSNPRPARRVGNERSLSERLATRDVYGGPDSSGSTKQTTPSPSKFKQLGRTISADSGAGAVGVVPEARRKSKLSLTQNTDA